ncbi:procathepsin L-like [Aedes albopictus]|uniref:Uncharacterized protein n=1 Tax=Aedes albopictus TaxID=7160 RepID=A0ABM1Z941_AEDAL
MKCFLILLAIAVAVFAAPNEGDKDEWTSFKGRHRKRYNGTEEHRRRGNFNSNKARIDSHNKRHDHGGASFRLGVNEFSDMSPEEFAQTMNGFKPSGAADQSPRQARAAAPTTTSVTSIDWRTLGAVTPVKAQGRCGSCYSFASMGALESHNFIKTGKLVTLSEQNIIDCTIAYGNYGCNGGSMATVYKYVKANSGVDTGASYPYKGAVSNSCEFNPANIGASITDYVLVPKNEAALQAAVATIGPVSVAIDTSLPSFQLYKSGIYYDPLCSSTKVTHGMLVVGFGTENGTDYWLIKNSYGASWGEQGYLRLARNKNNHCGVASYASYPIV